MVALYIIHICSSYNTVTRTQLLTQLSKNYIDLMNKISSLFKWLYQVIRTVDKYNTIRLNLAKDEKSTVLSLGKLFHTLITLSEKNDDLTLLVQCRLESLYGWPLVTRSDFITTCFITKKSNIVTSSNRFHSVWYHHRLRGSAALL